MDAKDCLGFRTAIDSNDRNMTPSQRERKRRFDEEREKNLVEQQDLVEYAEAAKRSIRERRFIPLEETPKDDPTDS